MKFSNRRFLTGLCLMAAALSVLMATAVIVSAAYADRVAPRTRIASQAVGGQKLAAASQNLTSQIQTIAQTPIQVSLGDQQITVPLQELGVTVEAGDNLQSLNNNFGQWAWTSPRYWQAFFRLKTLAVRYAVNDETLRQTLEKMLKINQPFQNAAVAVNSSGNLEVSPAKDGQTVDLAVVKKDLADLLDKGINRPFVLSPVTANPEVTTAAATQTKTELEQAVHPVYLASETKKFTVSARDLYGLITYSVDSGRLLWKIDESKLKDYLTNRVSAKINVKMVQKTIQSDNQQVLIQGQDGQQVDLSLLLKNVEQAIADSSSSPTHPLAIPVAIIAFTEKTVDPGYVANLFPGVYLDVNLTTQHIYVMNGGTATAEYLVSTGKWSTPTPRGILYIINKSPIAYSKEFKLWMPYWNGLAPNPDGTGYVGYGLHGLVCWDRACTNREGVRNIGRPVSHGCIRVDDDGAALLFETMPLGTPVNIH